jgi:hypothetical protein
MNNLKEIFNHYGNDAPALGAGDCEFEPRHPENTYVR